MIIHNLNVKCIGATPLETDAMALVYADAVLMFSIALQFLQTQAWPDRQIIQARRGVKQHKPFDGCSMELRRQYSSRRLAVSLRCDVSGSDVRER